MEFICYNAETAIILGHGNSAGDALIDARWNAGNLEIDDTAWHCIAADDALIDAVHQFDGAVRWRAADGVAVLT